MTVDIYVYKDIKSSVSVNGQLSQWFAIRRGCRQGYPISPCLFILCVEIPAITIKQNKNTKRSLHKRN